MTVKPASSYILQSAGDQDNKAEQAIADRELFSMFKKIQLLTDRQEETVKDFLSSYILKTELKQKLAS